MTTFLFWNIKGNSLEDSICRLVRSYHIDVVILAESFIPRSQLLEALNRQPGATFHLSDSHCKRIAIYTNFPGDFIKPRYEDGRMTIRHLSLPGRADIILTAVHMVSKLHWKETSQAFECVEFAKEILRVERDIGHARTVLVGDLNMNPYEPGIVGANGFHATMDRKIALKRKRTVQEREYPFFYNPMWNHLGDAKATPPGTYYYDGGEHVTYFWNLFDQVLVRPELLPLFDNQELKILTSDGHISFLSDRGLPDSSSASDHLPILFTLKM